MGYNGWSNYETWCVDLWLTNDEGTFRDVADLARVAADDGALAEALRGYVDDLVDQIGRPEGFVADLFGAALGEVDWSELAEHYRADAEDDADDGAPDDE